MNLATESGRARIVACAAAIVLVLASMALALAPRATVAPHPATPSTLHVLSMAGGAVAGEPIAVRVGGGNPGEPFELLVAGSLGTLAASGVLDQDGRAWVGLPDALLRGRGLVTVHHRGALLGDLQVRPAELDDVVRPYVGPRTIPADAAHHTMVVAVPTDVLGNPVEAGTVVTLTARRPDGSLETWDVQTNGQLAWQRVQAGTLAGRTELRVSTQGGKGPTAAVIEVPGAPAVITLTAPIDTGLADGRSILRVATDRLVDAFGNEVADGVEAIFEIAGPTGIGHVTGVVTAGRAVVDVVAPELPGAVDVTASIAGVTSPPLALTWLPAVDELPVDVRWGRDADEVTVGPVLDVHGAWVPDGTEVSVRWGAIEGHAQLRQGVATVSLTHNGIHPDDPVEVQVADLHREVRR